MHGMTIALSKPQSELDFLIPDAFRNRFPLFRPGSGFARHEWVGEEDVMVG